MLGLVESSPDPDDRRAVKVSLTDAGRTRVSEALDLRGTAFFARLQDWKLEDLESFSALLHAFNTSRSD